MSEVTIKDIAQAAGVSHPTVSKALNNLPGVSEKTRDRILGLARDMGYVPNLAAKRLANRRNRSIGFVWPKAEGVFFFHLSNAMQREAAHRKIDVLISMSEPAAALHTFHERFIEFTLCWFFPDWIPPADFARERAMYQGEVMILGGGQMDNTLSISIDRVEGVKSAVLYLADTGHQRIAFVGEGSDKCTGYREGLKAAGLPVDDKLLIRLSSTYYSGVQANRNEMLSKFTGLWDNGERPTALILDSQDTAFGFVNILRDLRISVPKDLSVICYDDIPELSIYPVPVTTVGPSIDEIVCNVMNAFENFYDGSCFPRPVLQRIIPKLVIRQSTRSRNQ